MIGTEQKVPRYRELLAGLTPWVILGTVLILVPIFTLITFETIKKQEEHTIRLLREKGEALIRSLEAGTRTGTGLKWSSFQFQKLLVETSQQPDIDYIIICDTHGRIIADSDPSMVGETYGTDLDLPRLSSLTIPEWRQVPNPASDDTFEVYRQFTASLPWVEEPPYTEGRDTSPSEKRTAFAQPQGFIIFVGMDMGPINTLRKQDRLHFIFMTSIFLLIGISGVVSLYVTQSYRIIRAAYSHIKAFSDNLVENIPIGIVALNIREEIIVFNHTAERILGVSFNNVLGKKSGDFLPGQFRDIIESLKIEDKTIEKEMECQIKDGQCASFELIATVIKEESGNTLGYVVLFRDITEILHMRNEMEKSRRLASIGAFAAGVAHEIRNPLSSIRGFATIFKERYRNSITDRTNAEIMIQEVDRLNRVISQLLEFARPMDLIKQWSSVQQIIHHMIVMVSEDMRKKNISLYLEVPDIPDRIFVDPDKLTQVLLNLLLNAIEAMDHGGILSIVLKSDDSRMIRLDISDTGIGMSPEIVPKIFDPYFTTKPTGTGLGLAIAYRIIEAHGGELKVESQKGKGTTVSVLLPVGS